MGVPGSLNEVPRRGDRPHATAWLVETPKWWMNLLAPIARPAFTWNHDKLMTDFGRGLAKATGGRVTRSRNSARKPGSPGFYVMPALEA